MANPEIIPCTPFLEERSPTSALIHDMPDHLCYGLGLSGHRNEAMAPTQPGSRTNTDIKSDLEQMVACGNFARPAATGDCLSSRHDRRGTDVPVCGDCNPRHHCVIR